MAKGKFCKLGTVNFQKRGAEHRLKTWMIPPFSYTFNNSLTTVLCGQTCSSLHLIWWCHAVGPRQPRVIQQYFHIAISHLLLPYTNLLCCEDHLKQLNASCWMGLGRALRGLLCNHLPCFKILWNISMPRTAVPFYIRALYTFQSAPKCDLTFCWWCEIKWSARERHN